MTTITLETALERASAQCDDGSGETRVVVAALVRIVRTSSALWTEMLPHNYDPIYTELERDIDSFRELVQRITED